MAAYIGPEIILQQFLLDPEHSLLVQAWNPQELRYARLNADGFGIGWYDEEGQPAIYTNPMPIWSDHNLRHLGHSLTRSLWLANVRSATEGLAVHQANTQPFCDDELLFMHNGFLREFIAVVRPGVRNALAPEIEADILGNTDSEYLFALLRQVLFNDDDISFEDAMAETFLQLSEWLEDIPAILNVIVSDGQRIYASRHAVNHDCASLYYTTDDDAFPGGQLIASEKLTGAGLWQPVPEHHILIMDRDEPPELIAL